MTTMKNKLVLTVCALGALAIFSSDALAQNQKKFTTRNVSQAPDALLKPETALQTNNVHDFLQQLQPESREISLDLIYAEGKKYYYGHGVTVDYTQTFEYWFRGAEGGHVPSRHGLGVLYLHGRGIQKDAHIAVSHFEQSAAKGYAPSYYQLGTIYFKGAKGIEPDMDKAFKMFTEGGNLGDHGSLLALGMMYFNGVGTAKDYNLALATWQKAAELGNKDAMFNIATMYENGQGVERNIEKAKLWYTKAAEHQHHGAIAALKELSKSASATPVSTEPSVPATQQPEKKTN